MQDIRFSFVYVVISKVPYSVQSKSKGTANLIANPKNHETPSDMSHKSSIELIASCSILVHTPATRAFLF